MLVICYTRKLHLAAVCHNKATLILVHSKSRSRSRSRNSTLHPLIHQTYLRGILATMPGCLNKTAELRFIIKIFEQRVLLYDKGPGLFKGCIIKHQSMHGTVLRTYKVCLMQSNSTFEKQSCRSGLLWS